MLKLGVTRTWIGLIKVDVSYVFLLICTIAVFLWHLSSQTIGLSRTETFYRGADKLSQIKVDPLFLPYKLIENLFYHLGRGHNFSVRLASVVFALGFLIMFFWVLKEWFGKPIATLSTLLLGLTPLYLLAGRTATPVISYAALCGVMYGYYLLRHNPKSWLGMSVFIITITSALYVPGLIWPLIIAGAVWFKVIFKLIPKLDFKSIIILTVLCLLMLTPLIYGFSNNHGLISQWLLLPHTFPGVKVLAKNFIWMIYSTFGHRRSADALSIGRLPLLDGLQLGLAIFGSFIIWERLPKIFWWLGGTFTAMLLLVALDNNYELLLSLLPLIAFVCGMGLRYLFIEWRKIFPKNPLAKFFATALMGALIAMHAFYGIRYALVAWPATPETKQEFVVK